MTKFCLILAALCLNLSHAKPVIEVIPDHAKGMEMFQPDILKQEYSSLNVYQRVQYLLEKAGYDVKTTDLSEFSDILSINTAYGEKGIKKDVAAVICLNMPSFIPKEKLFAIPKNKLSLFLLEPPSVIHYQYDREITTKFSKVFSWNDDLVKKSHFIKFYIPTVIEPLPSPPSFKERKLACLINSNISSSHPMELYSLRRDVIRYYEKNQSPDFHFYGRGWPKDQYKTYKGSPKDKLNTLKNYRFCYCFENISDQSGYITEKIFDCFACGTIPIYYGATNIEKYIPSCCFIDMRKFKSVHDVHNYINKMNPKQFRKMQKNIDRFLRSKMSQSFTPESFAKNILSDIL